MDRSWRFNSDPLVRSAEPSLTLSVPARIEPQNLTLDDFCRHIGFIPDAHQQRVLEATHKRIILNGARQSGKSAVVVARAVRTLTTALPCSPSVSLIVAHTMAQAEETIRKMDRFFAALALPTHGEAGKTLSRVLPNGSRVIGLAADDDKVRSYTANLVVLDEAARVPDHAGRGRRGPQSGMKNKIAAASVARGSATAWDAIEPTLATTNGDLIIASTPEGKRGLFWETWTDGGPESTVHQCPRVSKEFVESQRRKGDAFFKQAYECQFVESGIYLLGRDQVERLVTDKEQPPK
jgi:hypothetical protein